MQDILLEAIGLTKRYNGSTVLRGIDFAIARGQCVALTGHNGSGKSTLLRLMAGLSVPSAGRVRRKPGITFRYVPEHFPKMELTAAQYIVHMGRIEGMRADEARASAARLFADFFLEGLTDIPTKHLSKGTLQKVGVVQALLGIGTGFAAGHQRREPQPLSAGGKVPSGAEAMPRDILFLDEPLSGQDADSQQVFLRKATQCLQSGTAILLSCHEPHLIDRLADVVYVLDEGTLRNTFEYAPRGDAGLPETDRLVFAADDSLALPALPQGISAQAEDGRIILTAPCDKTQALLLSMLQKGYALEAFQRGHDALASKESGY